MLYKLLYSIKPERNLGNGSNPSQLKVLNMQLNNRKKLIDIKLLVYYHQVGTVGRDRHSPVNWQVKVVYRKIAELIARKTVSSGVAVI